MLPFSALWGLLPLFLLPCALATTTLRTLWFDWSLCQQLGPLGQAFPEGGVNFVVDCLDFFQLQAIVSCHALTTPNDATVLTRSALCVSSF